LRVELLTSEVFAGYAVPKQCA